MRRSLLIYIFGFSSKDPNGSESVSWRCSRRYWVSGMQAGCGDVRSISYF